MDGKGIGAALQLGAAGVQLGTAFIATDESAADEGYRVALFSDAARHTVMTRAVSGRPARCLSNTFTGLGQSARPDAVPDYPIAYDAGKALNSAAKAAGNLTMARTGQGRERRLPERCQPASWSKHLSKSCVPDKPVGATPAWKQAIGG